MTLSLAGLTGPACGRKAALSGVNCLWGERKIICRIPEQGQKEMQKGKAISGMSQWCF